MIQILICYAFKDAFAFFTFITNVILLLQITFIINNKFKVNQR